MTYLMLVLTDLGVLRLDVGESSLGRLIDLNAISDILRLYLEIVCSFFSVFLAFIHYD